MATESSFVNTARRAAEKALPAPLKVRRGAVLLYEVLVDERLRVTADPKHPVRGRGGFQTDLCILEERAGGADIPRVVIEFKRTSSTDNVITCAAKARKHKQLYPYLRYGLLFEDAATIPRRVFVHREPLDFLIAARGLRGVTLSRVLGSVLRAEVKASRSLQEITFGGAGVRVWRTDVLVSE